MPAPRPAATDDIPPPGAAPMEGVQFHPESFLTVEGPRLLANFLAMRPAALTPRA